MLKRLCTAKIANGIVTKAALHYDGSLGVDSVFRFLAREVSRDTYVNVMAQYHPAGAVADGKYPELGRQTSAAEVADAVAAARAEGLWRIDARS